MTSGRCPDGFAGGGASAKLECDTPGPVLLPRAGYVYS